MDESSRRIVGGITLSMSGIGVGIALVAVLTGAWISATIVPKFGAAEEEVVTSDTPLAFLSVTALAAPVIAVTKSGVSETTRDAALVGIACLVGAALILIQRGNPALPVSDECSDRCRNRGANRAGRRDGTGNCHRSTHQNR